MGLIDTMLRGDGGLPGETRVADVPIARRGTTQTGVRLYNERLVLALIRAHGSLPKAEIARLTGLSPQTVSVIVRQLEADLLVVKGISVKGKVGQPSQPYSLNPDGAFSIGLKVGRRSGDLALIDLDGKVRDRVHLPYRFPTPQEFLRFARDGLNELIERLGPIFARRVCGLGIAMPFDIWKWEEETGAPREVREAWHGFDLPSAVGTLCDWPVIACNDATAACSAELFFGVGRQYRDYGYVYVGYFAGGGLVINGHVHQGPTGNAGAFGSIPVVRPSGGSEQLIRSASLYLLEQQLRDGGHSPDLLWEPSGDWSDVAAIVDRWIEQAAKGLALATTSIAAIIDCPAVLIDGAMPSAVRARLVAEVRRQLARINLDGISPFVVVEGVLGIDARALGAASLPLFANYMTDRDVLFKETA